MLERGTIAVPPGGQKAGGTKSKKGGLSPQKGDVWQPWLRVMKGLHLYWHGLSIFCTKMVIFLVENLFIRQKYRCFNPFYATHVKREANLSPSIIVRLNLRRCSVLIYHPTLMSYHIIWKCNGKIGRQECVAFRYQRRAISRRFVASDLYSVDTCTLIF